MDIELLIPDKDCNWVIKHNILYYRKLTLMPLVNKIDGLIFLNLDRRCTKAVIRLINHFKKKDIKFTFCDRFTITEKNIWKEHIDGIFLNNLMVIEEEKIFNLIKSGELDYIKIICNFIKSYKCQKRFTKIYDQLKKEHFGSKWYDWYNKNHVYRVENQEIRDYYDTLFREVKISLLLSED